MVLRGDILKLFQDLGDDESGKDLTMIHVVRENSKEDSVLTNLGTCSKEGDLQMPLKGALNLILFNDLSGITNVKVSQDISIDLLSWSLIVILENTG